MTLTAGSAAAIITPPVGTAMEGYSARTDVSQGVHDDLHARALVLDDGDTAVAIVSCDLVGVDRRLVVEARDLASQKTGIPPGHILVAATHTHQGPAGLRLEGDDELLDVTARHVAGAIIEAYKGRRPAVLKVGAGAVDSVSMNRRHPDWPTDNALFVLLLDSPDPASGGPPIAAAINFACHPTVLYHTNLLLSADYPGHAVRAVEQLFPGLGALFLNGACGNVNPAWISQEHAEAERVGKVVGAAAARLIGELRPLGARHVAHNIRWDEHIAKPVTAGRLIKNVRLRVASRHVDTPVKTFLPDDEYQASLRELEARAQSATGEDHRRVMEQITRFRTEALVAQRLASQAGRVFHPELMAIGLAPDLALLGLPGEFFVETIAEIRRQTGVRDLPVACYANNYIGYVVPAPAFDQGGYEAGVTLLGPEAEGIFKSEAVSLLREVTG
jgi:neutral ceramidase